ncbi:MAG: aminotransferase class IV, partial [Bdellovibrionaceae bacterium]|nr:aminotransferase class IV [Pseudobdellovibrionaceae bacterium]
SRHNIFLRIDKLWLTPPVKSGLLSGVERQKVMLRNNAQEKILYKHDLVSADEIVLTNSLRGPVRVDLVL